MKQAVLRETLCTDENHQLHINVPPDMGDEFEVIVLPIRSKTANALSDDSQFMLAAYSAVIESNSEEDAIWEKYVHH
ncbi:MAG: hypothetical protein COZ20_05050 [Gallionellales bacterium CG_4_10_14_3_um_filter_54_96]|nr:MAG: hypothetical protein COW45_07095 [Gallionellales bacterium CG17_big_fil_post_rev_8_21_14_2_50_54_146]PIY04682.1 MAG: hypothetical protein COZ20_05050 [Gallionellales bacterium CG_4_10_14_3_um_filter_54_96]HCJ51650.1 hypothetical protein [Gallionella sp.]